MKKLLIITATLIFISTTTGCKTQRDIYIEEFRSYLETQTNGITLYTNATVIKTNHIIVFPSNLIFYTFAPFLQYSVYDTTFILHLRLDKPDRSEWTISDFVNWKDIEKDVKTYAEYFIAFSKTNPNLNLANYTIYVQVDGNVLDFLYDYTANKAYFPKHYATLIKLSKKYPNITNLNEFLKTDEGIQFLLENNIGEMANGYYKEPFSFYNYFVPRRVFISDDRLKVYD